MVKASAELVAVALRWVEAMNRRDFETAANLFQRGEIGRYIGTDPDEWWKGSAFVDAYPRHMEENPVFVVDVEEIEAFEAGSVGWAALRTMTTFGSEEPAPIRFTFVFVLDSGIWRIVQSHLSVGAANPEVLGIEITTSLEELLAAMGTGVEAEIRRSVRQGTVTLVFTDIEESTKMTAQLGDEAWAKVIQWHDATIRSIVEGGGGKLVKTLGDGAMAAFESVREAARSALEIQRAFAQRTETPELRARIGMHVGDVVVTEDDYLGSTVNKAARIAAAAKGGQVVASSSARSLLSDDPEFRFGEIHTVELKGMEGLHDIAEVLPG